MIRQKRHLVAALAAACACILCASCAETQAQPTAGAGSSRVESGKAPGPGQASPPSLVVSPEAKRAAITDVRSFVENLNRIIRQQDYEAWLTHLSPEYIAYYSDPETLKQISQYPVIKGKGIVLSTLKDFFLQVVYPAHQDDKVDDIDFIATNLVKAITISPKGDRNILYILEEQGDTWKIGIGR